MKFAQVAAAAFCLVIGVTSSPSFARVFVVKVDARSMPWDTQSNPRLVFGIGDGRAPTFIWGARLFAGAKVTFHATGSAAWIVGGERFGPGGDSSLVLDRSLAFLPYHFMEKSKPVGMGGLVGAFVNADGKVVGMPFSIGESAEVIVPDGAVAISLGINDDKYGDNDGSFQVTVNVTEPTVTVEGTDSE